MTEIKIGDLVCFFTIPCEAMKQGQVVSIRIEDNKRMCLVDVKKEKKKYKIEDTRLKKV